MRLNYFIAIMVIIISLCICLLLAGGLWADEIDDFLEAADQCLLFANLHQLWLKDGKLYIVRDSNGEHRMWELNAVEIKEFDDEEIRVDDIALQRAIINGRRSIGR